LYGWRETEALAMNNRDRIPLALREQALANVKRLSQAEVLSTFGTSMLTKDGTVLEISMTATALVNETGQVYAIATTERLRKPDLGNKVGVQ
jgi:two-component system CheB/CheR fusion protein